MGLKEDFLKAKNNYQNLEKLVFESKGKLQSLEVERVSVEEQLKALIKQPDLTKLDQIIQLLEKEIEDRKRMLSEKIAALETDISSFRGVV